MSNSFVTSWTVACQGPLSFTSSWSLLKFMSIESLKLPNHVTLCHPLLLLSSIFPSIRDFCNESALLIKWPKYWSFSSSPSNEYSGLISFSFDWFDHLAIQGTLRSLLQHHGSVQFSHSVVSNSLRPHESQHARPPCPSPTPRTHSDSRPSSQ